MKYSSWFAFAVAVGIHLGIAALVWISYRESPADHTVIKEKHFGINLDEFTDEESLQPMAPLTSNETISEAKKPSAPSERSPIDPVQPIPSTPPPTQERAFTPDDREQLPYSVLHHYGDEFFSLSAGEQHYIVDNLQRIRKLNEIVGTRLLRERYHDDVDPLDNNVVEFTLHPDGSISDLRLEKNRIGTPLDELTLQTVTLAHPKYPKPAQDTKIRIRVYIIIKE